jgi:hypothetical protein
MTVIELRILWLAGIIGIGVIASAVAMAIEWMLAHAAARRSCAATPARSLTKDSIAA